MKLTKSLVFAGVLTWLNTSAQYNDSTQHMLSLASTGSISKTKSNQVYLLNNSLKYGIRKESVSLNFHSKWVYGKTSNSITNNDLLSTLDFNLKTAKHFYYWGLANYVTSYSLKINDQLQTGIGVAYNLYDRAEVKLNLSDGILYERSDILTDSGPRDIYSTLRNSFRLSFRFVFLRTIVINSTTFFQNSLIEGSDYIIRSDNSLSLKIKKWLSVTAAISYNKFNRTKRENLLFNYGLLLEHYY